MTEIDIEAKMEGVGDLPRIFREKKVCGFEITRKHTTSIDMLSLFFRDNCFLEIYSEDVSLGPWDDVSRLVIRYSESHDNRNQMSSMPNDWQDVVEVMQLVVNDVTHDGRHYSCSSGLVLRNKQDAEMIIVVGSDFGTLALSSDFLELEFNPQCELSDYVREVFVT